MKSRNVVTVRIFSFFVHCKYLEYIGTYSIFCFFAHCKYLRGEKMRIWFCTIQIMLIQLVAVGVLSTLHCAGCHDWIAYGCIICGKTSTMRRLQWGLRIEAIRIDVLITVLINIFEVCIVNPLVFSTHSVWK